MNWNMKGAVLEIFYSVFWIPGVVLFGFFEMECMHSQVISIVAHFLMHN